MRIEILADSAALAKRAAAFVAADARTAVATRGIFTLAVSGGSTPAEMLRALAGEDVPWPSVHIFQVDERVAPAGDPDRNFTHLAECLLSHAPLAPEQIHAMPVEESDLNQAAVRYADELKKITGSVGEPPALDLVHLGLGPDGHTASLVPGDPVLDVSNRDVALAGPYQGRHRMTLTFPAIDRARAILWLVTGANKRPMLTRLLAADPAIPAGRVRQDNAWLLADAAAAGERNASARG
jgi:6-phosphogluconolactonase